MLPISTMKKSKTQVKCTIPTTRRRKQPGNGSSELATQTKRFVPKATCRADLIGCHDRQASLPMELFLHRTFKRDLKLVLRSLLKSRNRTRSIMITKPSRPRQPVGVQNDTKSYVQGAVANYIVPPLGGAHAACHVPIQCRTRTANHACRYLDVRDDKPQQRRCSQNCVMAQHVPCVPIFRVLVGAADEVLQCGSHPQDEGSNSHSLVFHRPFPAFSNPVSNSKKAQDHNRCRQQKVRQLFELVVAKRTDVPIFALNMSIEMKSRTTRAPVGLYRASTMIVEPTIAVILYRCGDQPGRANDGECSYHHHTLLLQCIPQTP